MKIVNLTPHDILIYLPDGGVRSYPALGKPLRVEEVEHSSGFLDDVPLVKKQFFEPKLVPEYEPETYYIVSAMVKSTFPWRQDFVVPNGAVRDDFGNIIGARSFYY
jgi:hypothetical protein